MSSETQSVSLLGERITVFYGAKKNKKFCMKFKNSCKTTVLPRNLNFEIPLFLLFFNQNLSLKAFSLSFCLPSLRPHAWAIMFLIGS